LTAARDLHPLTGSHHAPGPTAARLELLLTAALFSTGGAAVKLTTLSAPQVASFRSAVAALVLVLLLPVTRRRPHGRMLLVAACYATTMVLFVSANKLTTAASAIFLQATAPLYLLVLAPLVLKEPVRRRDLLYMATLGAGLALFFLDRDAASASAPDPFLGNLLGLASGVTWALTVLGMRFLGRGSDGDAAGSALWGNVLAALAMLPWALPVTGGGGRDLGVVLFLGTIQIGLAYALLTRAIRAVPALEASLLLLLEPVLNPLWAFLVLGEVPAAGSLAGGAIILGATAVRNGVEAARAPRPGRPRDP
jgi:drug/metabolite transporter (DMT)-like permease